LFGIVLIFVNIPHASLIYSTFGLVIFAGFPRPRLEQARAVLTENLVFGWPNSRNESALS
jgi:hypothetical protein